MSVTYHRRREFKGATVEQVIERLGAPDESKLSTAIRPEPNAPGCSCGRPLPMITPVTRFSYVRVRPGSDSHLGMIGRQNGDAPKDYEVECLKCGLIIGAGSAVETNHAKPNPTPRSPEFHRKVEQNMGLVKKIANEYLKCGLEFDDLVQEGTIGLMRAIELHDPNTGRFSTYAGEWIHGTMKRVLSNTSRAVRLPINVAEQSVQINRAAGELHKELDREPTSEEIAGAIGMDAERVEFIRRAARRPISLNRRVGDRELIDILPPEPRRVGGKKPIEMFNDSGWANHTMKRGASKRSHFNDLEPPVPAVDRLASEDELADALATLPEVERQVVMLRWGVDRERPCSIDEVGRAFDITRERVAQIEAHALAKLQVFGGTS